eukprot:TRINITY_DN7045_c0_g1_i1.p1 TRINITY_DN7045_c0_g1~~TRINITY_DN7045_c0_g1_i1.p1  ORF type:complete len:543 (+),score=110.86 TRINITY_DN7045_c0_g1_i1:132-1631(+)
MCAASPPGQLRGAAGAAAPAALLSPSPPKREPPGSPARRAALCRWIHGVLTEAAGAEAAAEYTGDFLGDASLTVVSQWLYPGRGGATAAELAAEALSTLQPGATRRGPDLNGPALALALLASLPASPRACEVGKAISVDRELVALLVGAFDEFGIEVASATATQSPTTGERSPSAESSAEGHADTRPPQPKPRPPLPRPPLLCAADYEAELRRVAEAAAADRRLAAEAAAEATAVRRSMADLEFRYQRLLDRSVSSGGRRPPAAAQALPAVGEPAASSAPHTDGNDARRAQREAEGRAERWRDEADELRSRLREEESARAAAERRAKHAAERAAEEAAFAREQQELLARGLAGAAADAESAAVRQRRAAAASAAACREAAAARAQAEAERDDALRAVGRLTADLQCAMADREALRAAAQRRAAAQEERQAGPPPRSLAQELPPGSLAEELPSAAAPPLTVSRQPGRGRGRRRATHAAICRSQAAVAAAAAAQRHGLCPR